MLRLSVTIISNYFVLYVLNDKLSRHNFIRGYIHARYKILLSVSEYAGENERLEELLAQVDVRSFVVSSPPLFHSSFSLENF